MNMQKSKAGRKSLGVQKKIARTITIDANLPIEVEKFTNNLSGFMNDATWEKLRREKRNQK